MSGKDGLIGKFKRVSDMSRDEFCIRASQELFKRCDLARSKVRLGSFASRHIRFGDRGRFFFQSHEVPGILNAVRNCEPDFEKRIVEDANRILQHKFNLLGYESLDFGNNINWHLDALHGKSCPLLPWFRVPYLDFDQVGDHKIVWELSRHQHLLTLAKAYLLTSDTRYATELFGQWYHWHQHNPYPIGINWASSLEVAFRSLSWLWIWHLLKGSSAMPARFPFDLRKALMQNGHHIERYLSTYFAPNTHLLGEAVALFFIGTLAPECAAVRRWQQLGWQIILRESQRQVLPDGMHFEQSTYYHVYALDFFLHARILADINGIEIHAVFDKTIENMLEALRLLYDAGALPQFGDDDGGRVFDPRRNQREHMLDPLATGAVLFRRGDFKSAARGPREEMLWLLGQNGRSNFDSLFDNHIRGASAALEAGGIYLMSSTNSAAARLLIDAGKQGPGWAGHGHADALSIQLFSQGKTVLVDPGTYTYVNAAGERSHFRATACHNTVQIDGMSQAEPAGPFKWIGLAHANVDRWITGEAFDFFAGSHAGYGRLVSPVTHRRYIFYLKSHFWLVRDVLEGSGAHQVDINWNFAPGSFSPIRDGVNFVGANGAALTSVFAATRDLDREISNTWFSPRYGSKVASPLFHVGAKTELPLECATALIPGTQESAYLEVIWPDARQSNSTAVQGYRLFLGDDTHEFYFAQTAGVWAINDLRSDACFVYRHKLAENDFDHYLLCDGTHLKAGNHRIIHSDCVAAQQEWSAPNVTFSFNAYSDDDRFASLHAQ